MNNNLNDQTDFGFRNISTKEKTGLVNNLFSSVANKYDIMNDIMSVGLHRLWKNKFLSFIPNFKGKFLDIASGTADIAINIIKKSLELNGQIPDIVLSDLTLEMLKIGRAKVVDQLGITSLPFVIANAEHLPFAEKSFDVVTIAFGIRNVTDKSQALREIYRVLKPGGKFICLEFSKIDPKFKKFYEYYLLNFLPQAGKFVAKDHDSYQYLAESIIRFPSQVEFCEMISSVGFSKVNYQNIMAGIAAIHYGWKI